MKLKEILENMDGIISVGIGSNGVMEYIPDGKYYQFKQTNEEGYPSIDEEGLNEFWDKLSKFKELLESDVAN